MVVWRIGAWVSTRCQLARSWTTADQWSRSPWTTLASARWPAPHGSLPATLRNRRPQCASAGVVVVDRVSADEVNPRGADRCRPVLLRATTCPHPAGPRPAPWTSSERVFDRSAHACLARAKHERDLGSARRSDVVLGSSQIGGPLAIALGQGTLARCLPRKRGLGSATSGCSPRTKGTSWPAY